MNYGENGLSASDVALLSGNTGRSNSDEFDGAMGVRTRRNRLNGLNKQSQNTII